MQENSTTRHRLIAALRTIGSPSCLLEAARLESTAGPLEVVHLRDMGLRAIDATSIGQCLLPLDHGQCAVVRSLSLSYNPLLGDEGLLALGPYLPESLSEIGLVGCGLRDVGGREILQLISRLPRLRMICVEDNVLSMEVRVALGQCQRQYPSLRLVY